MIVLLLRSKAEQHEVEAVGVILELKVVVVVIQKDEQKR